MREDILWPKKTRYNTRAGRSFLLSRGVAVSYDSFGAVHLESIDSRGGVGKARLVIPVEKIEEVMRAMHAMMLEHVAQAADHTARIEAVGEAL
jgi:hypothetical protein